MQDFMFFSNMTMYNRLIQSSRKIAVVEIIITCSWSKWVSLSPNAYDVNLPHCLAEVATVGIRKLIFYLLFIILKKGLQCRYSLTIPYKNSALFCLF